MRGRRLLLADDDPFIQRAIRSAAPAYEIEVISATLAREVVCVAAESLPDVIALDLTFPDESGLDILVRLKRDARTRSIPVVIWSGQDSQSFKPIALQRGAQDFLAKTDVDLLLVKINSLLRPRAG